MAQLRANCLAEHSALFWVLLNFSGICWFALAVYRPWESYVDRCTYTFGDGAWALVALVVIALCNLPLLIKSVIEAVSDRSVSPLIRPLLVLTVWVGVVSAVRAIPVCQDAVP